MIYREFQGDKISLLGMGTMRLPVIDGVDKDVDVDKATEMIHYAYAHGVNYFDTAWGYHEGNSETVLFAALKDYPRDTYFIADKFPGYDLSNMDKVEEIFTAQLAKGEIGYFDYYMFHNVCEVNIEQYMDEKYGIMDYLLQMKREGKIRHLGMSAHGDLPCLRKFLEKYGDEISFCQIQMNFLDYTFQNAKGKMELLKEYDIPVFVMEPLRGGRLAAFDDQTDFSGLWNLRPEETLAGWSMKYLASIGDDVKVVLTGANSLELLMKNIAMYEEEDILNEEELLELQKVAGEMAKINTVPCTGCRYCTPHCERSLNIPKLLELYSEHKFRGGGFIAPFYLSSLPEEKKPAACVGCRKCEEVCPQKIKISEILKEMTEMFKEE